MSLGSFVQAHAADADWRVALGDCQKQLQAQIAARATQLGYSNPFTLGWCYLSDYYALVAEAIFDELRLRFPAWLGLARGYGSNRRRPTKPFDTKYPRERRQRSFPKVSQASLRRVSLADRMNATKWATDDIPYICLSRFANASC